MVNLLPAIVFGGPPHAGKSVLFYQVTHALRELNIPHHAIRACPDGEGNWFQEGHPDTISTIRVKLSGEWPQAFVQRICQDLEHRCLPFLVDMGGHPRESQTSLFRLCTHAVLLLRNDRPDYTQLWQRMVEENNLLPLALLTSQQEGDSVITAQSPLLEGTLTGLERHVKRAGHGPVFDELVERIARLFNAYDLHDRKKALLKQAPTELVIDLDDALRTFTFQSQTRWQPEMVTPFLTSLPAQTPLSVYGVGPNWLYAALAAHQDSQPFYQFDPKLPFGWVQPVQVSLGKGQSPEIHIRTDDNAENVTILKITFPNDRLEYFQPDPLAFPHVPATKGLIIYGRAPHWLLTALTRLYKACGVPWIAPFYAQSNVAIVACSRVNTYSIGDAVPLPA